MFKKLGLILISFYQYVISPLLGSGKCRFHPSCSLYGKQAIKEYGVIKGSYLTLKRILRCNPLCTGGVDPVPRKFNTKPPHYDESN